MAYIITGAELFDQETLGSDEVTNGNMELDSEWVDRNSPTTNERSSEQAHGGTYSRKMVAASQFDGIKCGDNVSLVAGTVYKFTMWVYGDASGDDLFARTNAGGDNITLLTPTAFTAGWTQTTSYFIANTTTDVEIHIYNEDGSPSGTFYIDDVSIKEVTAPDKSIPVVDPWPALAGPLENSGNSIDNTFYRIMAQDGVDFTSIGAPDNNVGTYFYSNGVIGLDANDTLRKVQVSWEPRGSNAMEIDETNDALKVTYVNQANGIKLFLRDAADLSSDLVVRESYLITFDAYQSAGNTQVVVVNSGAGIAVTTGKLATSWTPYELIWKAVSVDSDFIHLVNLGTNPESVYIRNLSIKNIRYRKRGKWLTTFHGRGRR